jgi:hypothetical protein
MSTIEPTYEDPAVGGEAIARDRGRELLGPVMGLGDYESSETSLQQERTIR